jgi:bifunctional non-homologous end joining protein LigD
MPGFIEPCSPKIGAPPKQSEGKSDRWVHEIKFDGYRVQAHVVRGRPTLFTRNGFDWTDQFLSVADDLADIPVRSAIIDGELVVPDMNGIPDFHLLEVDLGQGRQDRMLYYAFDLVYLDGFDLRGAELRHRRAALEVLIGKGTQHIRLSEQLHPEASAMLELACRLNLEGIVSKRMDSPYRSGEQAFWLKQKTFCASLRSASA